MRYDGVLTTHSDLNDTSTFAYDSSDQLSIIENRIAWLMRMLSSNVDGSDFAARDATGLYLEFTGPAGARKVFTGA
jgi:hypothetical protein